MDFTSKVYFVGVCSLLAGCESDGAEAPLRAPPDAVPNSVMVDGSSVSVGTKLGSRVKQVTVPSFRVSRTPTSVKEYQQCVAAQACTKPDLAVGACVHEQGFDGPTYALKDPAAPVTCLLAEQAAGYCRWVGGRLPTIEQWLLAARGPALRRFAWGDDPPDCEKHWRLGFSDGESCPGTSEAFGLGTRTAGASPSGALDVLTTRGELVAATPQAAIPACRGDRGACVAAGLLPGAIDFFLPLSAKAVPGTEMIPASGFRCAWESE